MAAELHLRIVTPDRTIVDRSVRSVSFVGTDGSYGVLPHHAPLMTGIAQTGTVKVIEADGKEHGIFLSDGFAQVQHNVLTLVCEAGELAEEIDVERAKAAEMRARERISGDKGSFDSQRAEAALRRALARGMLGRRSSGTGSLI